MTTPAHGAGEPPLERPAAATLAAMRASMTPPRPPSTPLTPAEQSEASAGDRYCAFCAALHAGPSSPACPRLATFRLDGDGKVVEGTFWRPGEWEMEETVTRSPRVLTANQVAEMGREAADGER